jgi:hypothetical protein
MHGVREDDRDRRERRIVPPGALGRLRAVVPPDHAARSFTIVVEACALEQRFGRYPLDTGGGRSLRGV